MGSAMSLRGDKLNGVSIAGRAQPLTRERLEKLGECDDDSEMSIIL
jgi:hypothetical protein